MKTFLKNNAGILLGAVYGLIMRLVFNLEDFGPGFSLFSVSFVWITPVIIGLVPLIYASDEQLESLSYAIRSPALTVCTFFLVCFMTGIEDLLCLWIILIPFAVGAMTAGLLASVIILRIRKRNNKLYSVLLLPLLIAPIEGRIKPATKSFTVSTRVVMDASPETVWRNIIRVAPIAKGEYRRGFFNYAGIPRPLYAELDRDTLGATRIGHFEGGLQFVEKVIQWERNAEIAFDIRVVPSTIRPTVFDQHILTGDHFRFLNARYKLMPLPGGRTELVLQSSYELSTNINAYASWCGNQLLGDFQERLLTVIKQRCEQ